MRLYLILLAVAIIFGIICNKLAWAGEDQWFCTQQASRLLGDDKLEACGSGRGQMQDGASKRAFHAAHMEFWKTCNASSTCRGFPASIIPGRETCALQKMVVPGSFGEKIPQWVCHRMLTFIIDRSKDPCLDNTFGKCPNLNWPRSDE